MRDAGISVCAGGIIGLGEGTMDRVGLLHQLATLPEHPESVPINALVAVKGTPLQGQGPPSALDLVRCIATARVVMPRSVIRLSAGRITFNVTDQAMCFLAGANSIFDGDKLLTTPNNDRYGGGVQGVAVVVRCELCGSMWLCFWVTLCCFLVVLCTS